MHYPFHSHCWMTFCGWKRMYWAQIYHWYIFSSSAQYAFQECQIFRLPHVLNLEGYNSMATDMPISAKAIVCVNANFSQWRCHLQHPNPVDPHPDTHFLLVKDIESMKHVVEHARPSSSRSNAELWAGLLDDMLDDCEKAFTTAQGHIAKTNSTIFADTALMALLCHHDCLLLLVNMTSAGEWQYYTLALIKALFRHLPDNWVIGLLYNVACQLEHSMCKVCVSNAITVPGLSQALAQLLAWIHWSNNICSFGISCLWPSMGMSAHLPPAKIQRLWPFRWGGLRMALEHNLDDSSFSLLVWGRIYLFDLTRDYM